MSLFLNEDWNTLGDWVDGDFDTGVSEIDPAGQLRCDTNAGAAGNAYTSRSKVIVSPPNQFTIEIRTYFDALGTVANTDRAYFYYSTGTWKFKVGFASDGLFIVNVAGAAGSEVGVDLVKCNAGAEWQTWRFQVDKSAGEAAATVEVFLNDVSQGTVDCDFAEAGTDGEVKYVQLGFTTDDMVSHVDYIKIATGLGPITEPRHGFVSFQNIGIV